MIQNPTILLTVELDIETDVLPLKNFDLLIEIECSGNTMNRMGHGFVVFWHLGGSLNVGLQALGRSVAALEDEKLSFGFLGRHELSGKKIGNS